MPNLSVNVGPLQLKNPIVAGAGPLAGTVEHIKNCIDAGFGAVCTKTVSYLDYIQRWPRPLYRLVDYEIRPDDPYYVPDQFTWLHREHNSIYTPESFAKIIAQVSGYAKEKNCKIIGSINGRGLDEWEKMARMYEDAGCDALEINFCCPFPPADMVKKPEDAFMGIAFTQEPERGISVIKKVKETVKIPIFAKLSPDGQNFEAIARMFKEAGVDGLSMFANNRLMRVDIETGKALINGPCAGTGPMIKGHSIGVVARVAKECDLPIMGGRGASNWQDGVEFLMAGASAVQYCVPIMLRGLDYVQVMLDGLEKFMKRRRYEAISDFQGKALNNVYSTPEIIEKTKALYSEVDLKKCIGCGRCEQVCWYDAIKMHRKAIIKKENCVGCTICSQVCVVRAINVLERDNDEDHFKAFVAAHPDLAPEDIKREV